MTRDKSRFCKSARESAREEGEGRREGRRKRERWHLSMEVHKIPDSVFSATSLRNLINLMFRNLCWTDLVYKPNFKSLFKARGK